MRVILNPASRGGAGRMMRPTIEQALAGIPGGFEIVESSRPGHAIELAAAAVHDGVATVVAAGGDGTLHEVAHGLLTALDAAPRNVAFGIVPIGTGNDFAKVIPGARTTAAALRTLREGRTRAFDVGLAEWGTQREYFLNAMGTGIDVEVVRQITRMSRGSGALVYLRGLLRALTRYSAIPLRIHADGDRLDRTILMVAVANGRCIGGTFRIAPDALPDDGRLDLCIVSAMPLVAQLAIVPRILRGSHTTHPKVCLRRVCDVTLAVGAGTPLFFQLDGELREPEGIHEVRVTIQCSRLQIIAATGPERAEVAHAQPTEQQIVHS